MLLDESHARNRVDAAGTRACFQIQARACTSKFQIHAHCTTKPLYTRTFYITSCLASVHMYAQGRVLSDLCHVCDAPGRVMLGEGGSLGLPWAFGLAGPLPINLWHITGQLLLLTASAEAEGAQIMSDAVGVCSTRPLPPLSLSQRCAHTRPHAVLFGCRNADRVSI